MSDELFQDSEKLKSALREAYKSYANYYGKMNFGLNSDESTICNFCRGVRIDREDFDRWDITKKP